MGALAKIIGNVKVGPTIILLIFLTILFILMIILDYVYRIRRAAEIKACRKKTNDSGNYVVALRIIYILFYIFSIIITYRIIYGNIKSKIMKYGQEGLSGLSSFNQSPSMSFANAYPFPYGSIMKQ